MKSDGLEICNQCGGIGGNHASGCGGNCGAAPSAATVETPLTDALRKEYAQWIHGQGEEDLYNSLTARYEQLERSLTAKTAELEEAKEDVDRLTNSQAETSKIIQYIDDLAASQQRCADAVVMLNTLKSQLLEIEQHCPCGARPESLNTHPHVIGCPVDIALGLYRSIRADDLGVALTKEPR